MVYQIDVQVKIHPMYNVAMKAVLRAKQYYSEQPDIQPTVYRSSSSSVSKPPPFNQTSNAINQLHISSSVLKDNQSSH